MQIRLKGGRLVINCYQMKAKVRGWHYGAHKKQLLILTAQDIGKILEEDLICLNPSKDILVLHGKSLLLITMVISLQLIMPFYRCTKWP